MSVKIDHREHTSILTMDRPEALNAFDTEQMHELIEAFKQTCDRPETRVIVLTGSGDKAFAAGADIKEMVALDRRGGEAFGQLGHRLTWTIESSPQPVIAAVNGYALGGGCEVALAADIRLASTTAVFGQPEVSLGIPPGWGGTQRLTRLVGPGIASNLIFTGRRIDANEALRIGLVNAVHPPEELLERALEMASAVAANSPQAIRAAKVLIALAFNGQPASGLLAEREAFGQAFGHVDQNEGMRAFLEKRKPLFKDL
jgi:enoyl-CoA hydratase